MNGKGDKYMKCPNFCCESERTCKHCQENYVVSTEFYSAKRANSNARVIGYLVRDKKSKS